MFPATPALAFLESLGPVEILIVLGIALLLFGGEKLPELARGIGRAMRELKKATSEVEREVKRAIEDTPSPTPPPAAPPAPNDGPERILAPGAEKPGWWPENTSPPADPPGTPGGTQPEPPRPKDPAP